MPEFFEDHINEWMSEFNCLLQYENPLLHDDSEEDEPGAIDLLQQAVVENLNLYAEKYEEEFKHFLRNKNKFDQYFFLLLLKDTKVK